MEGKPPSIVLIVADDLGWADLGAYGADLHRTPAIDRFAARSLRFTDAYSASPVCTPTRASLLTGKHPARLKMTIWREASASPPDDRELVPPVVRSDLPHDEVTLAEVLHDAGYFTAHIGKWHLGGAAHYPETQGFDHHVGGTLWGMPLSFFWPFRGNPAPGEEIRYVPGLKWGRPGDYLTDRLTDEALEVIEQVGKRPFFLNLWYYTVHVPVEAPADLVEAFRQRIEPEFHHRNPGYAAMVASLDRSFERLLWALESRGLSENTIVVFTSDNGGFVNVHRGMQVTDNYPLRSGKGSLYEGGIRVPLMIRWPGVTEEGSLTHEPVSSIDLYPTLLDIAGLEGDAAHNSAVDGVSLVPLIQNPDSSLVRDSLYFHYPHYYPTSAPVSAVRSGDWKLLHFYETDSCELYNLSEDLAETTDLSQGNPEKVEELRSHLHDWLREVDAPMPRRR